jgi:hypothetical protein
MQSRGPQGGTRARTAPAKSAPPLPKGPATLKRICSDPESLIQNFLLVPSAEIAAPDSCYENDGQTTAPSGVPRKPSQSVRDKAKTLHFVIATLPDPVHSHLSLLFDRKIEAVQEAALDADFDYDSSWLPWETGDPSFSTLADQDISDDRKDDREDQPGILLFRKRSNRTGPDNPIAESGQIFAQGLVVFIVGEEATRGIHRRQFQNAAAWIKTLNPDVDSSSVAILGPTFSGSLPSLAQLLADSDVQHFLNYPAELPNEHNLHRLRIYSGSITSKDSVEAFGNLTGPGPKPYPNSDPRLWNWGIHFHSFVENDDAVLSDYCQYLTRAGLETEGGKRSLVALVSEDETAYGLGGVTQSPKSEPTSDKASDPSNANREEETCPGAVRVFFPRDISALRNAYQARSLFSTNSQSSADNPGRTLPTDLADPVRETHDTIRMYAESQDALAQEAQLFAIIAVLHDHHSEVLIIRSTNVLDQIFLARFFRRYYPQGRIAVRGADTLFLHDSGTSGITTLSSYPLIPWDWRDWPNPLDRREWGLQRVNPIHRIFGEETVEGTYIATRFLLQETFHLKDYEPLADDSEPCSSDNAHRCFLPPNLSAGFDIPDYKVPFWFVPKAIAEKCIGDPLPENCRYYRRPATWVSVLGRGNFYPLVIFPRKVGQTAQPVANHDPSQEATKKEPKEPEDPLTDPRFRMPVQMKLFLLGLLLFAGVHGYWCWAASFTAKPAFRAHFAVIDGWFGDGPNANSWQHPALITVGSALIACSAVLAAWGCGAFGAAALTPLHVLGTWAFLALALVLAFLSLAANHQASQRLQKSVDSPGDKPSYFQFNRQSPSFRWSAMFFAVLVFLFSVGPVLFQLSFTFENRLPAYWRSMDLASGVCPPLPFLILFAGMYLWFWYSLHGLALFGADRPQLPTESDLKLKNEEKEQVEEKDSHLLRMFSHEANACAERCAFPMISPTVLRASILFVGFAVVAYAATGAVHFDELVRNDVLYIALFALCDLLLSYELARFFLANRWSVGLSLRTPTLLLAAVLWAIFAVVGYAAGFGPPLRSLGNYRYALFFSLLFDLGLSWMLAEAWQFLQVWLKLKRLLTFLDNLALRRTMRALQGFSWGNVWRMGGNVLDVRYKLLSRQIETLNHLQASFEKFAENTICTDIADEPSIEDCGEEVAKIHKQLQAFAIRYTKGYTDNNFADFQTLSELQKQIASVTGTLISRLLIPNWRGETESLIQVDAKQPADQSSSDLQAELDHVPAHIRNAEELVCITYLGFAQNILGRLRTLAMGIVFLFVAVTLSVSVYPFDPRPGLNQALTFMFLAVGAMISFVYAEMHRDATLSRVTNTNPGELGMDFWIKMAAFGAGPLLSLVAYVFPGLTEFLFSWLEPGISAMK